MALKIDTTVLPSISDDSTGSSSHWSGEDADPVREEITSSKVSCDTIRKKINMFVASKEMTLMSFLSKIGVNHNSYTQFMKKKGKDGGCNNGTYWGALNFFASQKRKEKVT